MMAIVTAAPANAPAASFNAPTASWYRIVLTAPNATAGQCNDEADLSETRRKTICAPKCRITAPASAIM
jgi:hypothetical protein